MRVLLIDDHALFRVGLAGLLERHKIEVVAAVGDGIQGIELTKQLQPDIVLLDMRMPKLNGTQILQRLRDQDHQVPVAMLTTSTEERDLIDCLRNGAQAYLLKDMDPDDLVRALEDIMHGETVVAPELAGVLAKVVQQGERATAANDGPHTELTPREQEILCHLAEGHSNKAIAKLLGISDGTVKLHVKAILRKLGLHSRVEAAVFAVEKNLCQKSAKT